MSGFYTSPVRRKSYYRDVSIMIVILSSIVLAYIYLNDNTIREVPADKNVEVKANSTDTNNSSNGDSEKLAQNASSSDTSSSSANTQSGDSSQDTSSTTSQDSSGASPAGDNRGDKPLIDSVIRKDDQQPFNQISPNSQTYERLKNVNNNKLEVRNREGSSYFTEIKDALKSRDYADIMRSKADESSATEKPAVVQERPQIREPEAKMEAKPVSTKPVKRLDDYGDRVKKAEAEETKKVEEKKEAVNPKPKRKLTLTNEQQIIEMIKREEKKIGSANDLD